MKKQGCWPFLVLTSDFFLSKHRVSPGEFGFTPSGGRPRDQRRKFKNSLRTWNKEHMPLIASGIYVSITSSGSSFGFLQRLGKCLARTPAKYAMASMIASENW